MGEGKRRVRSAAIQRKIKQRHNHFYARHMRWPFSKRSSNTPTTLSWQREHWALIGTTALLAALCGVVIPSWANAVSQTRAETHQYIATESSIPLPAEKLDMASTEAPVVYPEEITIQDGQTLTSILHQRGVSDAVIHTLIKNPEDALALSRLRPGDKLSIQTDASGTLVRFGYDRDMEQRIVLSLDDGQVHRVVERPKLEKRPELVMGTIDTTLAAAFQDKDIPKGFLSVLHKQFQGHLDLNRGLQHGDYFSIVYEQIYRDGEEVKPGNLKSAKFYTRDKVYSAYRYTPENGQAAYFTEAGEPLQRTLQIDIKPIKAARITSGFTPARRHPILGRVRAHKGVDYAAPRGTKIPAAGDGTIVELGAMSGYGRYIRIKHDHTYSTAYAHMSRFQPGLKVGSRVKKGDTIGYVGSTGLATGPHLHFELLVKGTQVDPLKQKLPADNVMNERALADFKQQIAPLTAQMESASRQLATAQALGRPAG